MSGYTGIIDSTPDFVAGTFDATDFRLSAHGNGLPGLFAAGDFAASQRGAGANMSLDIAQGRCFLDPGYTHGGLYLARRTSGTAYNTSSDGGYTWTAADPTNPRIDLLCIEVADVDQGGSYTGWKFRIVDGTANVGATHQLEASFWPTIPTGCVPIAAIRVPAAATTLTTTNITNLNPTGGSGRPAVSYTSAVESTASASYARLTTPDFVFAYIPANGSLRVAYQALAKTGAATTATVTAYLNGNQMKILTSASVPVVASSFVANSTNLTYFYTSPSSGFVNAGTNSTGTDTSEVTTGTFAQGLQPVYVYNLAAAGWYLFEMRYKTTATTFTLQNRHLWAEVVG